MRLTSGSKIKTRGPVILVAAAFYFYAASAADGKILITFVMRAPYSVFGSLVDRSLLRQ